MEISTKTHNKWRLQFRHGDATKIAALAKENGTPVSRQAVSGALNGASADQKTVDAINYYYANKQVA